MYDLMVGVCEEDKIVCPYTQNQYKHNIKIMEKGYSILRLTFPEPEEQALCSNVCLVFDEKFREARYFTVEVAGKGKKQMLYLCEWDPGHNHYNYGEVPDEQEAQEKKIVKLITKRKKTIWGTFL